MQNVTKAQEVMMQKANENGNPATTPPPEEDPNNFQKFVYLKFDPANITSPQVKMLETDTTLRLLDFPFANFALYNDEFGLDEAKKEQLTDGKIYGVTRIENTTVLNMLQESSNLVPQFLDTLVDIPEADTALQLAAIKAAGATDAQMDRFGICFERPQGFVRYLDDETNQMTAVRGMEVWAIFWGIPVSSYTGVDGRYSIPRRFIAGTIMGTRAKNSRVTIKPFDTRGDFLQVVGQLIVNFIVGSVHFRGWVGACEMRSDVNFNFTEHKQNKYWSLLLNAYSFHDQFSANDQILNAPQNMICYAQWMDDQNIGEAFAPMLYHQSGSYFVDQYLISFFGLLPSGTMYNLMGALLPDMGFRVCAGTEPPRYSCRLTQTALHELGHAAEFRQMGLGWYRKFEASVLSHSGSGTYGTPPFEDWGRVQIGEGWAEFIGTNHARRIYPNGVKQSAMLGLVRLDDALEREDWFTDDWVHCGIYHDLIDNINTRTEDWDAVGGTTIRDMFETFDNDTDGYCRFQADFMARFPAFASAAGITLFDRYQLCR